MNHLINKEGCRVLKRKKKIIRKAIWLNASKPENVSKH